MADEPAQVLREHGLQVTAQRLAVLRAVNGHPHSTVEQLGDVARSEIGAISRQAVYDTLAVLVDRGVVRRIQPVGSTARYEARVGDNHHHLVCRVCGQLADVDCAVGQPPCLSPSQDWGYEIDEAEVAFWGRCPDCRAEDSESPTPSAPPRSAPQAGALRVSHRQTASTGNDPQPHTNDQPTTSTQEESNVG